MKKVSLHLEDNAIEVLINDDPSRNIVFNPAGVGFIEKYIDLVNFAKSAKGDPRYLAEVDESDELDGMIDSIEKGIHAYRLFFNDVSERVDALFGTGASEKATQGEVDVDILVRLIQGLSVHIENSQKERLKDYKNTNRQTRRASEKKKTKKN